MTEQEIKDLLARDPFIPFRIKLVNGDAHDVNGSDNVAVLEQGLYIASQDGERAMFPFDRIASLKSLIVIE